MRLLLACTVLLLASGATAQDTPTQAKSPRTATALSVVVPGGGHLYAGETFNGAALLGAAAVGAALAATAWQPLDDDCFGCQSGFYEVNETQLAIGLGLAGAAWLVGVVDAPKAARRASPRADVSVAPRRDGGATVALRVGL